MIGELDADAVAGYFRGKSILIIGSTGFLGKVLVEKILRVQPDVKKLFLLIRAAGVESAKHRVETEVTGREIFQVLKEKHGDRFDDFIQEKVCPLAGDIVYKNLGLDHAKLTELSKGINIIVNGAATTNFYERYDVAFDTNVMGAKHICEFAKRCNKLKMLLHVSTAYVAGEQEGILPEKPFLLGETLREGVHLDIESELNLIQETRREVEANCYSERVEKRTMKELGLKRTIDSFIIGYAKQALSIFLVDLDLIMDVVPGDMVVNAMMVAMAVHSEDQGQSIYHVTSSLRNPAPYAVLADSGGRYFLHNPPCSKKNGEPVRLSRMRFFRTLPRFRAYMAVKFRLPLEILRLLNIALFGAFSRRYGELSRKYRYVMHVAELYAPYALFKGCFDDTNTERLRAALKANKEQNKSRGYDFGFDPKSVDWDNYFYSVHIPGVVKYLCD
ncbi:fatty acyl-CoA reductase 1-like isoform X2 [Panicum hallii]|uniref:fatty acyl-CoA reductase 1-like isoform X2 n=1 Tax=Panicum hallii TaxID=206008 RepID=UPI000DF4D7A3|nr:fatty acyl-CoA reductase 1-like isoform X2 [Panicum hallii]